MPILTSRSIALLGALVLAGGSAARAVEPIASDEFRVNTHTANDQRIPSVAADALDRGVVVWQSRNQDSPSWSVHGQRLSADGALAGEEFRVNVVDGGRHEAQHVESTPAGDFVVAWTGERRGGSPLGIRARGFNADGEAVSGDRLVSAPSDDLQILPRLSVRDAGDYRVVWEARDPDTSFDILSARFDADGQALDDIVRVNQFGPTAQRRVDIAGDGRGREVAVWQSAGVDGTGQRVFGRCLDDSGPVGDEFRIDPTNVGSQTRPRVAMAEDGRFSVIWEDNRGESSIDYRRVMLRLYAADCTPLGDRRQVNQFDESIQDLPDIARTGNGEWVAVWQSLSPDFEDQGIYARRFDPAAQPLGDEFRVSQEREAFQDFPAVAGLADSGFLAAWESSGQDGSGFGIYARRFFGFSAAAEPLPVPGGTPIGYLGLMLLLWFFSLIALARR